MTANAISVIHKYIRRDLFAVSELLSVATPEAVPTVQRQIGELAELLRGHAHHEELRFEPLLRARDSALAARLMVDHEDLDARLAHLVHAAGALDPDRPDRAYESLRSLYLDWNRFVGAYLAHLDDEERALFPALADAVPSLTMIAESANSMSPDVANAFLEKLWKVVTPHERKEIESARLVRAS